MFFCFSEVIRLLWCSRLYCGVRCWLGCWGGSVWFGRFGWGLCVVFWCVNDLCVIWSLWWCCGDYNCVLWGWMGSWIFCDMCGLVLVVCWIFFVCIGWGLCCFVCGLIWLLVCCVWWFCWLVLGECWLVWVGVFCCCFLLCLILFCVVCWCLWMVVCLWWFWLFMVNVWKFLIVLW